MTCKVKILNITHRPCRVFNDGDVLTIHVGRVVAEKKSKDGFLAQNDIEWLCKNTVSDATGDNISELNRYYNEMTGIYWAWKNYDEIGNPDIIGFMHYRRHFILKEKVKITGNYLDDLGLTQENISKLMSEYSMITPKFIQIENKKYIDAIGEEFCTLGSDKVKQAINTALEIIKEKNINEYNTVLQILNSHQTGSFCNMFIMKKEMFFEYCNWIFPLLFEVDKRIGRDYKDGQERCMGWTAEMLTSIFIYLKSQSHSHKEVFVFNQDENQIKSSLKIFIQKCKSLFKYNKKYKANIMNYQLFRKYCK